jgi:hypothetical protein
MLDQSGFVRLLEQLPLPGYLREYNMKALGVDSNTTNTAEGDLMKELIFNILH